MGNKIKKIFVFTILLIISVFGINVAIGQGDTQSPIIRVGIMDNGFRTLERGSVALYSTETGYVCEPDTRKSVVKIPP